MNAKLLEVLKKAKEIDERAKKFDNVDKTTLESKYQNVSENYSYNVSEQAIPQQESGTTPVVMDVNSGQYRERVVNSKLPPEIQKLMLEQPIQRQDPSMGGVDEAFIKELNPSYGKQQQRPVTNKPIVTVSNSNSNSGSIDLNEIRKMIAEEISKSLPSIVEKYFDKRMIQENINILKTIVKSKRRTE